MMVLAAGSAIGSMLGAMIATLIVKRKIDYDKEDSSPSSTEE